MQEIALVQNQEICFKELCLGPTSGISVRHLYHTVHQQNLKPNIVIYYLPIL